MFWIDYYSLVVERFSIYYFNKAIINRHCTATQLRSKVAISCITYGIDLHFKFNSNNLILFRIFLNWLIVRKSVVNVKFHACQCMFFQAIPLISTSSYWWRRLISLNILSTLTPMICILVLSHDLLITWLNLISLCLVCDAITRSSNQTPESSGHVSVSLPSRPMVSGANKAQLNCKTSSLTSLSSSSSQEKGKQPLCYERVVVFRV